MNILVADDDRMSREMLRRIIESDGTYHVTLAEDGEEAWKLLSDSSQQFDIGMFDINMPKIDGLRLLEQMRTSSALRNIPVILCTAAADRNTVAKASTLSVAHYIVKPYAKNVILQKLQTVREEIARHGLEDRSEVLQRLGMDDATYRALVKATLTEISEWLQTSRYTTDLTKFSKQMERASGLRGACELLGLQSLIVRLGEIEFTVLRDSAVSKGQQSPLLFAQIVPSFEALEIDIKRVERQMSEEM